MQYFCIFGLIFESWIVFKKLKGQIHLYLLFSCVTALISNIGYLLGAEARKSGHVYAAGSPNQLGFVGDWSQARWGMVNPGITISISEEATINDGTNQINLWQRNMFALRVECELGFAVRDANAFIRLTD